MGRAKSVIDEAEVADLLAMKADFTAHRGKTEEHKEDVELLRKDVQLINSKQNNMNKVIGTVQTAVMALSQQLSTITDVLKTLGTNEASTSIQPPTVDEVSREQVPASDNRNHTRTC